MVDYSGPKTRADLENRFVYHTPKEGQAERYTALREQAKELASKIDHECPPSREKSLETNNERNRQT